LTKFTILFAPSSSLQARLAAFFNVIAWQENAIAGIKLKCKKPDQFAEAKKRGYQFTNPENKDQRDSPTLNLALKISVSETDEKLLYLTSEASPSSFVFSASSSSISIPTIPSSSSGVDEGGGAARSIERHRSLTGGSE